MTGDPAAEPTGGDETGPGYGPPSYGSPGYAQPGYNGSGYPGPGYGGAGYGGAAYGGAAYGQAGMRAAVADRERTVDILKAAYGEGRLTKEEFDSRAARAMAARTYGDLTAVVADLPTGPLGQPVPYQPQGYYPMVQARTNGLAVGALVCAILEFFTVGIAAIPALILGYMARGQIKRTGERGDGMAIAGIIFGWMGVAGWALFVLIVALQH